MKNVMRIALVCCVLAIVSFPMLVTQGRGQASTYMTLLKIIEVGGSPSAVVVDSSGESKDAIFYGSGKVRFIDGGTLELAPDELDAATSQWEGWMAYDRTHGYAYVVTTRRVWESSIESWEELRVTIIDNRQIKGGFSVNESYNTVPWDLVDLRISVEGLEIKQAKSEGNNPTRLIVDGNYSGLLHVVDLKPDGVDLERIQRANYRPALTIWYRQDNPGNSLALEIKHETLGVDDLATDDLLYIADLNDDENGADDGYITAVRITHPLEDIHLTALPDVDLTGSWPFGSYGLKGIMMAGQEDLLYVSSAQQSFDDGYVGVVNTTNNQVAQVVTMSYSDQGRVYVNWYDPKMVFVPTFDGFYNDPDQGLYLNLLYNGVEKDRLLLEKNHDEYESVGGMAYDPYNKRLYLTVGSKVMVVGVNFNQVAPPTTTLTPTATTKPPDPDMYKFITLLPIIAR